MPCAEMVSHHQHMLSSLFDIAETRFVGGDLRGQQFGVDRRLEFALEPIAEGQFRKFAVEEQAIGMFGNIGPQC